MVPNAWTQILEVNFKHEFHKFAQISMFSLVCEINFTNELVAISEIRVYLYSYVQTVELVRGFDFAQPGK